MRFFSALAIGRTCMCDILEPSPPCRQSNVRVDQLDLQIIKKHESRDRLPEALIQRQYGWKTSVLFGFACVRNRSLRVFLLS